MRHHHSSLTKTVLTVLAGMFLAVTAVGGPLWTHRPASDIKWYKVTEIGTVLLSTKGGLYVLDGESGGQVWARNDLANVEEFEVNSIANTPFVLVSRNSGAFQKSTMLYAVDLLTGKDIWTTDKLKGSTVAVQPIYEKDLVLLVTVDNNSASKGKPQITALRMTTGEFVWEADFPDKVDLYGIERGSKYFPKFDLSGANSPLYDDDSVYFTYAGLHRYSLQDGKLMWKANYDVTEGALKRGNAQAIIDGDVVYTSAKGQVRAIDRSTGQIKWTSRDFGAAVGEMKMNGDVLYGRLGGAFYDFGKREYVNKKPYGVAALDKKNGAPLWYYEGAKDSITNMLVLPAYNTVLIADSKNIIGLDTTSTGKVKEAYKIKLEFKYKLGAAATAAKVAKFGLGGLSAIGKGGADTTDEPVSLYTRENGTIVVAGKQHLLAFNPSTHSIAWSVQYEAPGMAGWQKIAMAALTAVSYSVNTGIAMNSYAGTSTNTMANRDRINSLAAYEKFVSKRFSATKATGNYVYVLTTVKEGNDKGAGLIGVQMETGQGIRQILFKDKDPNYQVDELEGRVFNLKNEKELSAFAIGPAAGKD